MDVIKTENIKTEEVFLDDFEQSHAAYYNADPQVEEDPIEDHLDELSFKKIKKETINTHGNESIKSIGNDPFDFIWSRNGIQMSDAVRCILKGMRPTPKLKIKSNDRKISRTFQMSWYNRFKWLAGNERLNRAFCYVCLLYGGEKEWCTMGCADLKNFILKAVKHQSSKQHLYNAEAYEKLGLNETECLSGTIRDKILNHNREVKANRRVVSQLMKAMLFLAVGELDPEQYYNQLLSLLSQYEASLGLQLKTNQLIRDIKDKHKDFLEAISTTLDSRIREELDQAEFVSFQVDGTLDVSCKSQVSVIFRYCVKEAIKERFIGLFDFVNNGHLLQWSQEVKTAYLLGIISKTLKEWGVESKVVSQTHDGFLLAEGEGEIHNVVKHSNPKALCIYSYTHKLNLLLLQSSVSTNKHYDIVTFITSLNAFNIFFKGSPKRSSLFNETLQSLLSEEDNFLCNSVTTLWEHFNVLKPILKDIAIDKDSVWDYDTLLMARNLLKTMDDPIFVYLLCVYYQCFSVVYPIIKALESDARGISAVLKKIHKAITVLDEFEKVEHLQMKWYNEALSLNTELKFNDEQKNNLRPLSYIAVHSINIQMKERFKDLYKVRFADLVNMTYFEWFRKAFPHDLVSDLIEHYPYFNRIRLQNELSNLYEDKSKELPPRKLLNYLVLTGLDSVYDGVTRLLRLVLTLPVFQPNEPSAEGTSTLERVKNYLRRTMSTELSESMAKLAIEREFIQEQMKEPDFIEACVKVFSEKSKINALLFF